MRNGTSPRGRLAMLVTSQLPGYDIGFQQSGHAGYVQSFIDDLVARDFDVTVVALRPSVDFLALPAAHLPYSLVSPGLATVAGRIVSRSPVGAAKAAAWKVYARLPRSVQARATAVRTALRKSRGFAHVLGHFLTPSESAFVQAVERAECPALVLYDGIFSVCPGVTGAQRWIITEDVKYLRARSFEARGVQVLPARLGRDVERLILEGVGNIIAIHGDDADEFRRMVPRSRIVVVPVTVDAPRLQPVENEPHARRCIFVGSGTFHNLDGIMWFIEACWPKVLAAEPEARLDIVGTVGQRLSSVPPSVRVRGVVPDLQAAYGSAAVAVVPLRIGSGLKMKLAEAFAFGVPSVTTSVGAQGLMGISPRPFVLADNDADFAAGTIELLRSPARRTQLSLAARECAHLFTRDSAFAAFAAATEERAAS